MLPRSPALLVWAACSGSPAPPDATDRETYARLLNAADGTPEQMRTACGEIEDRTLRGDCQLVALERANRHTQAPLEDWCSRLDAGTPRDECWFVVAERRWRRGDASAAAQACRRAGPFEPDCVQHIWEDAVVALAAGAPPAQWPARLEAITAEIDGWVALFPQVDALADQMWVRFYERGLARPGAPLDLTPCTPLPRPDATRCRLAGTALYARRLSRRADRSGVDLCARPARVHAWADLVPARTHPRLDRAVAALQQERCAGEAAQQPPPSSGD